MKRLIVGAALMALAGCVADQSGYLSYKVTTDSGEQWSANDLKADYRKKTGKELPEPQDLKSCGFSEHCFYRKWHAVYAPLIREYDREQEKAENERKSQEIARAAAICAKNPACRRRKAENEITQKLQRSYETMATMLSRSPAEGDSIFREFCGQAATAQRQGISRAELAGRVEDLPGISPYYRQFFVESAEACWDSAKLGMSWKEAIRVSRYR